MYDSQMERYQRGRAEQSHDVPVLDVEGQPYIRMARSATRSTRSGSASVAGGSAFTAPSSIVVRRGVMTRKMLDARSLITPFTRAADALHS